MSPLGTVNMPSLGDVPKDRKEYYDQKLPQGRTIFGHQMKLIDDNGNDLPQDGETQGRLLSRGFWVLKEYFEDNTETLNKLNELCSSSKSINEVIFLNNFRNTIEFYDGLIFEIFDSSGTYRLISGGRYDKLLKSLGSDEKLCAVGFATFNNEINKYLENKSNGQN